jgi:hypothetical protein
MTICGLLYNTCKNDISLPICFIVNFHNSTRSAVPYNGTLDGGRNMATPNSEEARLQENAKKSSRKNRPLRKRLIGDKK